MSLSGTPLFRPLRFILPCIVIVTGAVSASAAADDAFVTLQDRYENAIHPVLKAYCVDCHATAEPAGELDLERFTSLDSIRRDPATWQKVEEMLRLEEMPPQDSPQPTKAELQSLGKWVENYLAAEAAANAGDPGPVILRRLNNAEYTYTLRDLTGVDLDPAREFPTDGAAGEGFTNTGGSLVMSPSLVTKYLSAAREVANHAVLLPTGIRFSAGTTRRDWTNEILDEIRGIYFRHIANVGDTSLLDRWNVADPKQVLAKEGRIDLEPYFAALLEHQMELAANPAGAHEIAPQRHLNGKYLHYLAETLLKTEKASPLLEDLRRRMEEAQAADAAHLATIVRAWQDRLWKFNSVGHFGSIRPWQEAVDPLQAKQEFRLALPPEDVTVYLSAQVVGEADTETQIRWQHARIEKKGQPPVALTDLATLVAARRQARQQLVSSTERFLAAAWRVKSATEKVDLATIAKGEGVSVRLLEQWLELLQIRTGGTDETRQLLPQRLTNVAGHAPIGGWGSPGHAALSLVANSSDQTFHIPGQLRAGRVAVHPRPERWIAVGWRSPIDGKLRIEPHARDAHDACGNGFAWQVEHLEEGLKHVLSQGEVDSGGTAQIPASEVTVQKGDFLTIKIGSRAAEHTCDLTEIDLKIVSLDTPERRWNLAQEIAPTSAHKNPHPDRYGNDAVWHFYTGLIAESPAAADWGGDSLLAQWRTTDDPATASRLARQIATAIQKAADAPSSSDQGELYAALVDYRGPLLAAISAADAAEFSGGGNGAETYGLTTDSLEVSASSVQKVRLPGEMFAEGTLVIEGTLARGQGAVQLDVSLESPDTHRLRPEARFVVPDSGPAADRLRQALDDFRDLFPAVVCYPQIVPVDEVVTLVLFHREDNHLARLMLSDDEAADLDRLWKELRYVSQDALTIIDAYEQLMEYATQDGDPTLFEPLRQPIYQRAEEFREQLQSSQPVHLEALVRLAGQAFRRPLTDREKVGLRSLYAQLRQQNVDHDEAVRLSLARIFTSPAFLYRLEMPGAGQESVPVSDWELATRLSYFLWSSTPDEVLRQTAEAGTLHEPQQLVEQTQRMLQDDRVRRLAIEFACQWLQIRQFDEFNEKSEQHFPQFEELRGLMYEESICFFEDLFRRNGSVLEILEADHTFLNQTLAEHYAIPGVEGDQWRRVEGVRAHARGGILGLGAVLAKNSGASRTSPILRGIWVSETLLGERLPNPPLDVPVLPEIPPAGLTERQLTEMHSSVAECASCHKRIDPYGFALEQFDTIGAFRKADHNGLPIDTQATLLDGTEVNGMADIRAYLANDRRETVVRQFCRKLLGYALGRSVRLSDQPLLDQMHTALKQDNYRVATAIEQIVLSRQFREIRGKDYAGVE